MLDHLTLSAKAQDLDLSKYQSERHRKETEKKRTLNAKAHSIGGLKPPTLLDHLNFSAKALDLYLNAKAQGPKLKPQNSGKGIKGQSARSRGYLGRSGGALGSFLRDPRKRLGGPRRPPQGPSWPKIAPRTPPSGRGRLKMAPRSAMMPRRRPKRGPREPNMAPRWS